MMDVALQTVTQSKAHRIAELWAARVELVAFPPGLAESVEAVDKDNFSPAGHRNTGSCLVLFSNVRCSPREFNQFFTRSVVLRSVTRVFYLRQDTPQAASKAELVQQVLAAPLPDNVRAVRLEVAPKSMTTELAEELLAGGYAADMQPAQYSHVLQVVQLEPAVLRWSYIAAGEAWKHPCDEPAPFGNSVASAINKLAEAVQLLGLAQQYSPQQRQQQPEQPEQQQQQHERQQPGQGAPPQQRWAIDVGASPGGWTSFLADCGLSVAAVDPAALHPDVEARPSVAHIRAKAEEATERLQQLLQGQQAELLVSDMNIHFCCVGDAIRPMLQYLKPGGWLILTLKFFGRGREKSRSRDTLNELFSDQLQGGRMVHLMANTVCERTYMARKKAAAHAGGA